MSREPERENNIRDIIRRGEGINSDAAGYLLQQLDEARLALKHAREIMWFARAITCPGGVAPNDNRHAKVNFFLEEIELLVGK